jgi:hypothetical protein
LVFKKIYVKYRMYVCGRKLLQEKDIDSSSQKVREKGEEKQGGHPHAQV